MFHSASIAIVTGKPTYMLDPYFQQYSEVSEVAEALRKKAILSVYKTLDSEKIGIIIGLKEGQFAEITALKLKRSFEQLGKKVAANCDDRDYGSAFAAIQRNRRFCASSVS